LHGDPEFAEIAQNGSIRGSQINLHQSANLLPVGTPWLARDVRTFSLWGFDQFRPRRHLQILASAEAHLSYLSGSGLAKPRLQEAVRWVVGAASG
jgi:hypothetical protein